MTPLSSLCLDLFLLGHVHLAEGRAGDGFGFEKRVREHLGLTGLPDSRGFRFLGRRGISGLYHQIDEQTSCVEALVVGEWKAYVGTIPKNDLLRFKAATDDYWLATGRSLGLPVVRVFGGTGRVTEPMRSYAAHWGIILVTPDRWPVPSLCDPDLVWGSGELDSPPWGDRLAMTTLARPIGSVLIPQADGSWRVPPIARAADVSNRLALWEYWSGRAWGWWDDTRTGRFETLLDNRVNASLGRIA